jgi:hypothetical protein
MISSSFLANEQLKAERQEERLAGRRNTNEVAGSNYLERPTIDGQVESADDEDENEAARLKRLFEAPENENSYDKIWVGSPRSLRQMLTTVVLEISI